MAYKIEWGKNYVHISYSGNITIHEIFEVTGLIASDLRYQALTHTTSNFIDVTGYTISESDINNLSSLDAIPSILNPNIKLAVVSNNNNIQGMVMKYIDFMSVNEWEIKLFDNLEESMAWGKQK